MVPRPTARGGLENISEPARQSAARPPASRYGFALAMVVLGWAGREALVPFVGPTDLPFIFFFPAVAAAAWYGGLGPAILSAAAAAATAFRFFIGPAHGSSLSEVASLVAFLLASAFIVGAIDAMQRARARTAVQMSERDIAETERAKAQYMLATTLASIGDGVIVTDTEGRITFINPEAERLTGWQNANVAGQPLTSVFRVLSEAARRLVEIPVEKVLESGAAVGIADQTLLVSRDGTEIPIAGSVAPIRTADSPTGVVLVFRDVREQRAIEKTRAHLAAIVQFSGDAIITKDLNAIVQSWNAGAERLFGYRPEEIIGKPVTLLIPPDRLTEENEILARLRQGLPYERIETIRLSKDGRAIPVSLSVSPIKDKNNHVIGASKIVHDISDIVAARKALDQEKELLATTLRSIGDAVIVTDPEGKVTFLNPEAERLTGWKDADAAGQPLPAVFRIINEQTRQAVENPVAKVIQSGSVVGLANHTLLLSKDGAETAIDDSAAPIIQPGGTLYGVVLVFRDFTIRRQAELKLRESEERFRLMADAAPVLIWVSGTDKRFTWVNQRWLSFVGRSMEQELGNGWTENVHPDDLVRCLLIFTTSFDARGPFSISYRLRRYDGVYRWIQDDGIPLYELGGRFAGYIGSCVDITERQAAEQALRDASRRKDEFLAILSHELRNPVAPIRLAVEMLKKLGPPELDVIRDTIERQTVHLTRLLDDLLDVTRISTGKVTLVRDRMDLKAAISSALESTRPQMEALKHKLTVRTPATPLFVEGDLVRLAQVFSNLLSNAAKYTEPGGQITLTLNQDENEAVVTVTDQGIGISPDQIPRIFDMFTQVDQSLERKQGGLGVGLAVARNLVGLHGGRIDAKSEGFGTGSVFTVRLPLSKIAPEVNRSAREKEPQGSIGKNHVHHRVLVADDNVDSAAMLSAVLDSLGHEVRIAHDGVATVEIAKTFQPDLAVVDIGMPRLSGYDAARQIRTHLGSGIVLIAVTGWGQEEDKRRAMEAGFDYHLTKPVDLQVLYKILERVSAA